MIRLLVFALVVVCISGADDHWKQYQTRREHDGLPSLQHEGPDHEHNPEYDHEAFLGGKEEAAEFDDYDPEESKKKLGEIFHKIDGQVTTDDFVTREELDKWIEMQQNSHIVKTQERSLKEKDVNNDNKMSWEEYEKKAFDALYSEDESIEDKQPYEEARVRDKKRFVIADANGDGLLEGDEVGAFVNPEYHTRMHKQVLVETMDEIDKNKDGFISFKEYVDDNTPEGEETEEQEWMAFEKTKFNEERDTNKDGRLDEAEVRAWVLPDFNKARLEEVEHLIKEADADKDGKLSKEEMISKYDVFVGSTSTAYSDEFNQHEEL